MSVSVLEQLKVLKGGLRDHVYLEQSIDMAKKMGLTISETDILATTSKGIVVSNQDVLNSYRILDKISSKMKFLNVN